MNTLHLDFSPQILGLRSAIELHFQIIYYRQETAIIWIGKTIPNFRDKLESQEKI